MTVPSWGEFVLSPGETREMVLGTLRLEVRRLTAELWVRISRTDGASAPEDGDWVRWSISPEARIELLPSLPDRRLVVSTEHPFHLPPRGKARLYVRVPLHARIVVTGARGVRTTAVDAPSLVMSDSWWGTFTDGELAYWMTTKARVDVTDDLFLPHLAMCPFALVNDSKEPLPVGRFAVQVSHLSLFSSGDQIWTDEVRVRYGASDEGSEIEFGGRPPEECKDGVRMQPPREAPPSGIRALTFARLISKSGIGL